MRAFSLPPRAIIGQLLLIVANSWGTTHQQRPCSSHIGSGIRHGTISQSHQQPPHTHITSGTTSSITGSTDEEASYEPWEVRALVLALLPPAQAGAQALLAKEVLYLLPRSVRRQLMSYDGGLLAYARKHFSDDIVVESACLLRKGGLPSGLHSTPSLLATKEAIPHGVEPPPPPRMSSSFSSLSNSGSGGAVGGEDTLVRSARPMEVLDALVGYIPTFYVNADAVAVTLPADLQKFYAETTFSFYLRRFKHYVDLRQQHGVTEVRLRPDFSHEKRGLADIRFLSGGGSAGDMHKQFESLVRRPPRNSEANLLMAVLPRTPTEYTPLPEILQQVSAIVSRHPSFDARLGVTGFFTKYPEYFQVVNGKMRVRPYRSAPGSTDDLDSTTSPLPTIFAKISAVVEAAAEGRSYADEASRKEATVPTGRLYALLSAEEKATVKAQCRSFPRFLRLHGKVLVVAPDSMLAYKFKPEYERCAETILDQRLLMNFISPDDPVLKIPAEIDASSDADWAVRELYDAMPLMQCAEMAEMLMLVPAAVRAALPESEAEVSVLLERYPEYFTLWPYPDDPRVTVVQRAKLEAPPVERAAVVRALAALIPQGGTQYESLRRRVPLPVQRYLYRHGIKAILHESPETFLVSGDRVIRVDGGG